MTALGATDAKGSAGAEGAKSAGGAEGAPIASGDLGGLRLNQIRVIGTHNSYHLRPDPTLLAAVAKVRPDALSWDYEHAPLEVQLERGVRSFELDVHNQPEGWEVFHLPLVDNRTSCRRFTDCLKLVRDWSERHPRHVPISFLIEIKDEGRLMDKRIRAIDAESLDRLDADVRSVFPPDRLITPDDVRGEHGTLAEAVRAKGWPLLEEARGKVLFILHEQGENRDLYTAGRPSLEGRAMFIRSEEGRPDCAAMVLDTPRVDLIQRMVKKNYLVRTTADGDPGKSLAACERRRAAALESGAQIITTDYPPGEAHAPTGYVVAFADGAAAVANHVLVGAGVPSAIPEEEKEKPGGIHRLAPSLSVDMERGQVLLDAQVVLREGPLELLVCPVKTKEHESILAAQIEPKAFHLALLMVGAKPGRPAEFEPYRPPTGQRLQLEFEYAEGDRTKRVDARQWVRDVQTGKTMEADFVFSGSRFYKIPGEERSVWLGDEGDLICVTNFQGSIIDVSVPSSTDNANLSFEAWPERIPPRGTKVRVIITPIGDDERPKEAGESETPAEPAQPPDREGTRGK